MGLKKKQQKNKLIEKDVKWGHGRQRVRGEKLEEGGQKVQSPLIKYISTGDVLHIMLTIN